MPKSSLDLVEVLMLGEPYCLRGRRLTHDLFAALCGFEYWPFRCRCERRRHNCDVIGLRSEPLACEFLVVI